MDSTNEKLVFELLEKKTKKQIYQHQIELLKFQKETLQNENVSLFYTFKDTTSDMEVAMASKLKFNQADDELTFVIRFSNGILHESELDIIGIDETNIGENEVQLYFIFEKISKQIINKIAEEHKRLVLSK